VKKTINIKFWGVRGSTPCANKENMRFGGNTMCLQVEIPGNKELLIFDCGTGFRNLGNHVKRTETPQKGRIFITHPHWDHLQGFSFFKPFYDAENHFQIYLPPQGSKGCEEILQGHMSSTFFPVSFDMLEAQLNCETIQPGMLNFEHYSVEYMWATHTVPTAAYKIKAHGKTLVFCPDNELEHDDSAKVKSFKKRFRAFIHGADVLIHDAQYNRKQYAEKAGWGHSAWEDVVEMAADENVQTLCLTHHDPDNNDVALAKMEEEVERTYAHHFNALYLAKEGQELSLPFGDAQTISAK
jgi:phosphoribosyl 1,2-cyclic phosphodiesterase